MDEDKKNKMMDMMCGCGSGKIFKDCHTGKPCWCGSGKIAEDCCMASPETHGVDMDKMNKE